MAGRSIAELLRLTLLYAALVVLAALSRPSAASVALGGTLILLGEAIRVWAAGHLFKTRELITSGPYRYSRNPLYLGRLLLLTGLCVMAWFSPLVNGTILVLGWALFFGYYMRRKERIEPARLERIHGEDYRAYKDAIPALFPTLSPWPDSGGRWRRERFLRNREHLTAIGLTIVVAVFAAKVAIGL